MNFKMGLAVALTALSLGACTNVAPGYVGVRVNMYGSEKGVEPNELITGMYFQGPFTTIYTFPTFTQNYCWTKGKSPQCGSDHDEEMVFQTREGLTVRADVGITFAVVPHKATQLFQKYRKGIDEITHGQLRQMVATAIVNEASNHSVEEVYGLGKVKLLQAVQADVAAQVKDIGINIEHIYWIGDMRLPQNVIDNLNNKIAATQMAQQRENEIQQTKAEAQKVIEASRGEAESVRIRAQTQAEANKILAQSITAELVQYEAVKHWNGVLPQFTGGGQMPFIMSMPVPTAPEKK